VHDQRLAAAMAAHDVVVVQALPSPRQLIAAVHHAGRLVVDLIAPLALELAEVEADRAARRRAAVRWRSREMVAHIAAADLVLCGNERLRDLALGAGMAAGLLASHAAVPLQERFAVVPQGIDAEPPRRHGSPLRREGIGGDGDRIAVWAGGLWSWLDPLTAIKAVERLRPARPDLKLAFVGLEHPDPVQRRSHEHVLAEAVTYARDRALEDAVAFRPRWLSREEYVDHLLDADVGVSLHGPTLEGRFGTRTRVLDYLYAGLPVICTRGDAMSDLVAATGVGQAVEPLDVVGCAAALDRLTTGTTQRLSDRAVLEPFLWHNVARPLVDYCRDPGPPQRRSRGAALALAMRGYPAFLRSVYRVDGRDQLGRALVRAGSRALRRGSGR
jgi:glycosyltransferase involved in cell wall biosynthesis